MSDSQSQGSELLMMTLEKALKNHKTLTSEGRNLIQSMGLSNQPQEGLDYLINQKGKMVFTAIFHLRRGNCCGSGCMNCPY